MTSEVSISNNKRIALWDNVKFLMILFVVIGHLADAFATTSNTCKSIYIFIYAFHMPLFIFISGLFYSEKNTRKKFIYYCLCGFALKFTLYIVRFIIDRAPTFSLLSDDQIPWFMFSIAELQVLMYFLKGINKKFLLFFSIILACFVGLDKSIGDFLYLSRTIIFFPFFLLGTMINKEVVVQKIKNYYKLLLPVAIIVLAVWAYLTFFELDKMYIYRHLLTARNPFIDDIVKYGPVIRLLYYFMAFVTSASFLIIVPKKKLPIITKFGSRTLNVFFWHWPLFLLMLKFTPIIKLFNYSTLGKIAYLLIGVILTLVIMSLKIFDFPLKQIKDCCFSEEDK